MNNVNGKNVFRKTVSAADESKKEKFSSFRKGLTERLSTPLRGNNTLERIPGQDILLIE